MTKPEIVEKPYTNDLDQVINVNDKVLVVTTGYCHQVTIREGIYLGLVNNKVKCKVNRPLTRYRHNETGLEADHWMFDTRCKNYPHPKYPTGFGPNTPEYAKYREDVENRQRFINSLSKEYTSFKVPRMFNTTLQRNRIYKLDTSPLDLKL